MPAKTANFVQETVPYRAKNSVSMELSPVEVTMLLAMNASKSGMSSIFGSKQIPWKNYICNDGIHVTIQSQMKAVFAGYFHVLSSEPQNMNHQSLELSFRYRVRYSLSYIL